jgi:hypothetical protein
MVTERVSEFDPRLRNRLDLCQKDRKVVCDRVSLGTHQETTFGRDLLCITCPYDQDSDEHQDKANMPIRDGRYRRPSRFLYDRRKGSLSSALRA